MFNELIIVIDDVVNDFDNNTRIFGRKLFTLFNLSFWLDLNLF